MTKVTSVRRQDIKKYIDLYDLLHVYSDLSRSDSYEELLQQSHTTFCIEDAKLVSMLDNFYQSA